MGREVRSAATREQALTLFFLMRTSSTASGLHISLSGALLDAIERGLFEFKATLQAGSHPIEAQHRQLALLAVPASTTMRAHIDVIALQHGAPVIRSARLEFSHALSLSQITQSSWIDAIWEQLGDYSSLVSTISEQANKLPSPLRHLTQQVAQRIVNPNKGPLGFLRRKTPSTGDVASPIAFEISQIVVDLQENAFTAPRLKLNIVGSIVLWGQVRIPLERIIWPTAVLPLIPASLKALLALTPWNTPSSETKASSTTPNLFGPLLQRWLKLLDNVEVSGSSDVSLPELQLMHRHLDGTHTSLLLHTPSLKLGGRSQIRWDKNALLVENAHLELSSRLHTVAKLEISGSLDFEALCRAGVHEYDFHRRLPFHGSVSMQCFDEHPFPEIHGTLYQSNLYCHGGLRFPFTIRDVQLGGRCLLGIGIHDTFPTIKVLESLKLRGAITTENGSIRAAQHESIWNITGRISCDVTEPQERALTLELTHEAQFLQTWLGSIMPIPEFNIAQGKFRGQLSGTTTATIAGTLSWDDMAENIEFQLAPSKILCACTSGECVLDDMKLTFPAPIEIELHAHSGILHPHGFGPLRFDTSWNFHQLPWKLETSLKSVEIAQHELRQGRISFVLNSNGRLAIAGSRSGMIWFDAANVLLAPGDYQRLWKTFFVDDAGFQRLIDLVDATFPNAVERLKRIRTTLLRIHELLVEQGIRNLGSFIPQPVIARMISLLLVHDASLEAELLVLVRKLIHGDGIAIAEFKQLIGRFVDMTRYEPDIDMMLRWFDLLLKPQRFKTNTPEVQLREPLVNDARFRDLLVGIPSAQQLYEAIANPSAPNALPVQTVVTHAPQFSVGQLGYLVEHWPKAWARTDRHRIEQILRLKKRIHALSTVYGGIEGVIQAEFLSTMICETLGLNDPNRALPVSAEEIAMILRLGLAQPWHSRRNQINNRLILETLERQPASFTKEMLLELAHESPRALPGILVALLNQPQHEMTSPLDLPRFFSERLGLPIPDRRDFMATGPRAHESYFQALAHLSERLLHEGDAYRAQKQHRQRVRHPVVVRVAPTSKEIHAIDDAQTTIRRADELGQTFMDSSRKRSAAQRDHAASAYLTAAASCGELLRRSPMLIGAPWLKRFWARHEEALRVLSVVRAYQQKIDRVRDWVSVRLDPPRALRSESKIVEAVIQTLYRREEDQLQLQRDPLVHLLIDPPEGTYDFTIIGCPGVITQGEAGFELSDVFERLQAQRGIQIIRADTSTLAPLEHNAHRIIDAIRRAKTPWGLLGYSQGCANALLAESLLRSGTPDEQALLNGLIARNFLFSSANGTIHLASGAERFVPAIVLLEFWLKRLQLKFSKAAVHVALQAMQSLMDSYFVVQYLGGSHSLTRERARTLHRDGQFMEQIPTSYISSILTKERVPEALEYGFYSMEKLADGEPHDSQVLLRDAVPYSTLVENAYTETLRLGTIPSLPQATHHWAPLKREVEFVTTPNDRDLAVYESPKDQLVWAWVEVNARFGHISRR